MPKRRFLVFVVLLFVVILALNIEKTSAVKKKLGAYLIGGYLFHKWVKGLANHGAGHSNYQRSPRYSYASLNHYGGGNFGGFGGTYPGHFGGYADWSPLEWDVGEYW